MVDAARSTKISVPNGTEMLSPLLGALRDTFGAPESVVTVDGVGAPVVDTPCAPEPLAVAVAECETAALGIVVAPPSKAAWPQPISPSAPPTLAANRRDCALNNLPSRMSRTAAKHEWGPQGPHSMAALTAPRPTRGRCRSALLTRPLPRRPAFPSCSACPGSGSRAPECTRSRATRSHLMGR